MNLWGKIKDFFSDIFGYYHHLVTLRYEIKYVCEDTTSFMLRYSFILKKSDSCKRKYKCYSDTSIIPPERTQLYINVIAPWLEGDRFALLNYMKEQKLKISKEVYNDAGIYNLKEMNENETAS